MSAAEPPQRTSMRAGRTPEREARKSFDSPQARAKHASSAAAPGIDAAPAADSRLVQWRARLAEGRGRLRAAFVARADPPRLLRGLARLTDEFVRKAWAEAGLPKTATLVAVGGYGRGQLFPHSDVDVLILLPIAATEACAHAIERLLTSLWDIGVELSHAVRTLDECAIAMRADA